MGQRVKSAPRALLWVSLSIKSRDAQARKPCTPREGGGRARGRWAVVDDAFRSPWHSGRRWRRPRPTQPDSHSLSLLSQLENSERTLSHPRMQHTHWRERCTLCRKTPPSTIDFHAGRTTHAPHPFCVFYTQSTRARRESEQSKKYCIHALHVRFRMLPWGQPPRPTPVFIVSDFYLHFLLHPFDSHQVNFRTRCNSRWRVL